MKKLQVVLLAGGQSKRFWPLQHKNLLPFLGAPLIRHQIQTIKDAGFDSIVVVTNKETESVIRGIGVEVVFQKGTGMASALLSTEKYLRGNQIAVIIANDFVETAFFKTLRKKIAQTKNNLLVTYRPKKYLPMGYVTEKSGKVTGVVEKPGEGKEPSDSVTIFAHLYQNGDKLLSCLKKTKSKKDDVYERALESMIKDGDTFEPVLYDGVFAYLKYPWHMLLVMDYFLSQMKHSHISRKATIDKSARIQGPVWIEDGARVMEYAKITGPCYIGRNVIVGNHTMVRSSHIGQQSVIGFGSDVTRSYIGALSWLHTNYVGDSVLGENVSMGSGTVLANLRFDEQHIHSHIKQKRVSSQRDKLGAIIGDNVRIGVNASIMPGVKIGRNATIGAGVVLGKDILDNKHCYTKQSLIIRDQKIDSTTNKRDSFRKEI